MFNKHCSTITANRTHFKTFLEIEIQTFKFCIDGKEFFIQAHIACITQCEVISFEREEEKTNLRAQI